MDMRLTVAFCIYVLYSIRSFDCLDETDQNALYPPNKSHVDGQDWHADTHAFVRAKRHTSHVSLIKALSAHNDIYALSPPSKPKDRGAYLRGYEYDNAKDASKEEGKDGPGSGEGGKTEDAEAEETEPGESGGDGEIVTPLILYLIIAGLILMMIALLVLGIAIIYVVTSAPAKDKDDDASAKGNACSTSRTPSFSRCPSLQPKVDDRRYSQQSVDLVHKSRGSSLSRQSSCRICPRFNAKSSGGRASSVSTSGSLDAGAAAKKDYFVACVCDLPGEEEYSPSTSTTTTFGRC